MEICNHSFCTGCGMCSNLCPVNAISMQTGENDFVYPIVDETLCVKCNQCSLNCPANQPVRRETNVKFTYAAWNKNKVIKKQSSSGGVFSVLAEKILKEGGIVIGVAFQNLEARHVIVTSVSELPVLNGSKYVQSNTGNIYQRVKDYLESNKKVLFSGTPCQVHALKQYIGKDHSNLYLCDLVCHGVPSLSMLHKHLEEVSKGRSVRDVKFRYKDPYWDFSYVRIDYEDDKEPYQKLTVDDDYFHLFNIGFSIRNSCHNCHYANTHRQGDITLADYWGYRAHNFKMCNYFGGISLVLVNNSKGQALFDSVKSKLQIESALLQDAKRAQKCLNEPFCLPSESLKLFWDDYCNNMAISELSKKHCPHKYVCPNHLWLRHLKSKLQWIANRHRR